MSKLQGKVAVITGGTSGIGLATAAKFVQEGAYVYIAGRRQSELNSAVEQLGQNVTGIQADVSNLADLDRLYATVKQQHKKIDIVFANAGGGGGGLFALGDITEEHFDKVFDGNVKGLLFTVQKALPLLNNGASIVLTGSTTGSTGAPSFSVYSASKAAVRSFSRNWILDLKDRGIRVNTISPGPVKTPGLLRIAPPEHSDQLLAQFASQIPLGRVGTPDEIANAVLFLASDESSFVNGIELFADGGLAQI
jgi:NAD(P)-dependent dehydrogenase (short-subunit alcohol dehydrogenase family)